MIRPTASIFTLAIIAMSAAAQSKLDFARDVRPILANHCWSCHGFDEEVRGAGLRLDARDAATSPLKNGRRAIVPGNAKDSAVVQRLYHEKPSKRMPPPEFKKPITDAQRDILKRWIEEGAVYSEHWAFVPPARPPLPTVKNKQWPINPIDFFILARLEREGLAPSPPASKETLLRRAALDLTGLPPTLDDLDRFLKDPAPDAYEKAVDRLLASPRYAEKMAVSWLDLARYADTNGYNNDDERTMWPWRDWVLRAFDTNMPYDQFLVEQLAGDLLPKATLDQKIATGFNRNHGFTTEGGIIEEEYRVEYVADRVHTASTAALALSFQCARCHEHKYDPISQKEYYEFYAFFNNIEDKLVPFSQRIASAPYVKYTPPEIAEKLTAVEKRLKDADQRIATCEKLARDNSLAWESRLSDDDRKKIRLDGLEFHLPLDEGKGEAVADGREPRGVFKGTPRWTDGKFGKAVDINDSTFVELKNVPEFTGGEPFSASIWIEPKTGEGTILSKMNEKNAHRGYDFLIEGGGKVACHIVSHWPDDGLKIITKSPIPKDGWRHLAMTYDGSRKAAGVKIYVDGKLAETTATNDTLKGVITTPTPFRLGRRGDSLPFQGKIDDVRLYRRQLSAEDVAALAAGNAPATFDLASLSPDKRTPAESDLVARHYLDNVDAEYAKAKTERSDALKAKAELEKGIVQAMVMDEQPKRRETFILKRGQYDQLGEKVSANVPAFLPPLPKDAPRDRLALAKWLVDPKHPLTARVAVNRWWEALFGAGIVETVEDFGLQGELPSHPELIDWLATELIRTKWDVKAMHKLIVTSATYRQSSKVTADHLAKDPKNRLLGRSPRYRLPAETVRDNALAVSGLLKEKLGGPSVKPYQPAGLWEDVSVERRYKYVPDQGDGLYRRGLYTFWRRTIAPPGMTTFDAPNREYCVPRRSRTNTPLQALILQNDPTYVEAARIFAERMMKASPGVDERLSLGFRLALSREPSRAERRILSELLTESRQRYGKNPDVATKLLATGDRPRDPALDPVELASWTVIASTSLNLDEAISRP
jgi:hypothetical protein